MTAKPRRTLRQRVRSIAGIALVSALLAEIISLSTAHVQGFYGGEHLLFAVMAIAGALLLFFNVPYSAYIVLPLALGIFFYEVYRSVSATISVYTVISGVSFFVAALLSFMLIRAHKT
jgi:hypothetical protein